MQVSAPQQQSNPAVAQTQQALGQPAQPQAPAGDPQSQMSGFQNQGQHEQDGVDDGYDHEIAKNLEAHLDGIPDEQKAFLVDNLTPATIALVGIINGQEVFDYLRNVYETQILPKGPQQNSGAQPDMASQGAMPQMGQNPATPQAKATPAV